MRKEYFDYKLDVSEIAGKLIVRLALAPWVFMLIWNWKMPVLFGLPRLRFWDAWWISCMVRFLTE